jgi:hypothetical protein
LQDIIDDRYPWVYAGIHDGNEDIETIMSLEELEWIFKELSDKADICQIRQEFVDWQEKMRRYFESS